MIALVAVVAGGIGGVSRYWLSGVVQRRARTSFPWGTLAVNAAGAFLLGAASAIPAGGWSVVATAGFLGGFTTFSTWMVESVVMIGDGRPGARRAGANLVVSILAGTLAFVVGRGLFG